MATRVRPAVIDKKPAVIDDGDGGLAEEAGPEAVDNI